ncbi:hypothetical protein WK13_34575 [Burkholderia ubonensis]|uniref:hypothetical protein n=1 Tax=Burkholderia ubonensis TaxID=101571 RepID=UPI00075CAD1C|nr:hypothetical protein [Burkholderia ubonensis]KVR21665.1 hypothetical protein WK13_34575 [Burkholderia ubonensis]
MADTKPDHLRMQKWKVYEPQRVGHDKLLDEVFYTADCDADHVRKSEIEYSGRPSNIYVERSGE